jgi:uncharacterized protein YyaL (SSP411 family)
MSLPHPDQTPNRLIHSSSPYLLQHAYNPVDWYPWGEEALEKARTEDKPILVSIGYSACHWCHVMERESFENLDIAAIMNRDYVNIKVDREERPDIDQIYMEAVQIMGLNGGWPLNVILTPEAEPFYGGTYFPPQQWANLLLQVRKAFREHREELVKSAKNFTAAINRSEIARFDMNLQGGKTLEPALAGNMFQALASKFDHIEGGMKGAPKFPMPCLYTYLLRHYDLTLDEAALKQVCLTLDRMAFGGIYDQVGGGFARYSVDAQWFAPHFEKMLYDNAQLISLYAEAFSITRNPEYARVIRETYAFATRELLSPEGGFYSALDADSEGVEGKFYTWASREIDQVLGPDAALFKAYYQVTEEGNWEHGVNILHANGPVADFALQHGLDAGATATKIGELNQQLLQVRARRIRPGLDDKILASWNGLMLTGLCDAYAALSDENILQTAIGTGVFIKNKLMKKGLLWHVYKNQQVSIQGYLEDYATIIQGFTALYQVTFDEQWLLLADKLAGYALRHFYDQEEGMFFFTDDTAEKLIARKKEIFDNVIPASNSIMARNLYTLALLLDRPDYETTALAMLQGVLGMLEKEVRYLANWGTMLLTALKKPVEIAIIGPDYETIANQFHTLFIPNKVMAATEQPSKLPLLVNRLAIEGKTTIYVCQNKACQLPVFTVEQAIELIEGLGESPIA